MLVFTDVSCADKEVIHVGTVVKDGEREFKAAFTILRLPGECQEDTAIKHMKRMFPDAEGFHTDHLNSKEGTYVGRHHPLIKCCHKLARSKLHSSDALIEHLRAKQERVDAARSKMAS
jgi:hypothetical protein